MACIGGRAEPCPGLTTHGYSAETRREGLRRGPSRASQVPGTFTRRNSKSRPASLLNAACVAVGVERER